MDNKSVSVDVKIPDSIDHAVENLTGPITKNIGQTIGDLFYLVFGGIPYRADMKRIQRSVKLKEFEAEVRSAAESIPTEHRKDPDLQIAGQALQQSLFCIEHESLRDMFTKLIAASMDSRKEKYLYPCFAQIISQFSPLDAQNIKLFNAHNTLPIARIVIANNDTTAYKNVKENIFLANPLENDYNRQAISIASLIRSGIIDISYDEYLTEKNAYTPFYDCELFKTIVALETIRSDNTTVVIKPGIVHLTPLGTAFVKAVISE